MPVEQSAIQLMPLPELWPPLDTEPTAGTGLDGPGRVQPVLGDQGPALPRQFAILLAETLAGVRPARQLTPWLSKRGGIHLHRLMPLFESGHQPRVLRVLTTRPAPDVIEMTMIVVTGPRTRALAVRLEYKQAQRWLCTDIEAA
jgi:hypothetical protein